MFCLDGLVGVGNKIALIVDPSELSVILWILANDADEIFVPFPFSEQSINQSRVEGHLGQIAVGGGQHCLDINDALVNLAGTQVSCLLDSIRIGLPPSHEISQPRFFIFLRHRILNIGLCSGFILANLEQVDRNVESVQKAFEIGSIGSIAFGQSGIFWVHEDFVGFNGK